MNTEYLLVLLGAFSSIENDLKGYKSENANKNINILHIKDGAEPDFITHASGSYSWILKHNTYSEKSNTPPYFEQIYVNTSSVLYTLTSSFQKNSAKKVILLLDLSDSFSLSAYAAGSYFISRMLFSTQSFLTLLSIDEFTEYPNPTQTGKQTGNFQFSFVWSELKKIPKVQPYNLSVNYPQMLWSQVFCLNSSCLKSTQAHKLPALITEITDIISFSQEFETEEQKSDSDNIKLDQHLPFSFINTTNLDIHRAKTKNAVKLYLKSSFLQYFIGPKKHEKSKIKINELVIRDDIFLGNQDFFSGKKYMPITEEWNSRAQFIQNQYRSDDFSDWGEIFSWVNENFELIFKKNFRDSGAELFYFLSQSRLEESAEKYLHFTKDRIWKIYRHNTLFTRQLAESVKELVAYYQERMQSFRLSSQVLETQLTTAFDEWKELYATWKDGNRSVRKNIAAQYPIRELIAKNASYYINQCKRLSFQLAIVKLDAFLSKLEHYMQELHQLENSLLLEVRQTQSELANNYLAAPEKIPALNIDPAIGSASFLLQPDAAFIQIFPEKDETANKNLSERIILEIDKRSHDMNLDQFELMKKEDWYKELDNFFSHWAESLINEVLLQGKDGLILPLLGEQLCLYNNEQINTLMRNVFYHTIQENRKWTKSIGKDRMFEMLLSKQNGQILLLPRVLKTNRQINKYIQRLKTADFHIAYTSMIDQGLRFMAFDELKIRSLVEQDKSQIIEKENTASSAQTGQAAFSKKSSISLHMLRVYIFYGLLKKYLFIDDNGNYRISAQWDANYRDWSASSISNVIDQIPDKVIERLQEEHWKKREVFSVNEINTLLEKIREECLSNVADIVQAQWEDAGRYVVWVRAAKSFQTEKIYI